MPRPPQTHTVTLLFFKGSQSETVIRFLSLLFCPFIYSSISPLWTLVYRISIFFRRKWVDETERREWRSHRRIPRAPLLLSWTHRAKTRRCGAIILIGCDFFIYMTSACTSWETAVCFSVRRVPSVSVGHWALEVLRGARGLCCGFF